MLQRRYVHPIFGNHLLSCLFVRGMQKGKHDVAFDPFLIHKGTDVKQLDFPHSRIQLMHLCIVNIVKQLLHVLRRQVACGRLSIGFFWRIAFVLLLKPTDPTHRLPPFRV
ncbi:Uncharacterised protein [Mycobacterium tuberculosis]|nr:Uncharacterised protein [Mycobacterium tuberculosis]